MTKTLPVLSFAKLETGMPMPHLLDIQTRAFQSLLQPDGKNAERSDVGLERVFKDLFPIQDVNGNYSLEFVKYALGEPKYTVEECIERDMTYSVPLKATLQLVVMEEVGETTKTKRPKNIIEKEVYLGELPILTPLGTFVINGAERVIVSQLHRSPGVVFEESIHPNGQRLFSARIIPFRGSWVEFTVDIHDVIYVHIDKKKKFPATALLRAFGYGTTADILKLFYALKEIDITGKLEGRAQKREVLGTLLAADVPDPENKKGEPLVAHLAERLALLVLGVGHVGREQRPQHFALLGPALELAGDVDVLGRVEQLQDVGVGAVPEGPEQRRRRELLLLVDVDVDHVVNVDRELDPRAPERDDARREQPLAVGVDALFEHHAGRAVQLRHDHPLGAVDHEGAERREDRQLTEIDFLLDDVLGPFGLDGLAHLFHDHQLQRRLQRHRIGHVPLDALLDRVLRLPQPVLHELEGVVPVHVLDREHVLEHALQPDVGALRALPVRLQQGREGARLDVQEVRHRHPLLEFCERQHR